MNWRQAFLLGIGWALFSSAFLNNQDWSLDHWLVFFMANIGVMKFGGDMGGHVSREYDEAAAALDEASKRKDCP